LELVAIDKLEVELRVSEAYFNAVQVGKTQVVLHSALLKDDLAVPVTRIVGQIDQAQGTFPLRIVIPPERRDRLVPGAFVTAEILLENDGQVIVPLRAVVHKDGNNAVFVAQEGKMLRRQVVLGDRLTEGIVVKSGLKPGQKVLVGPSEAMKDGQKLPDYLKEG
jgi:RND family efflux transporter MFP subunit